jgi:hypothetical protein
MDAFKVWLATTFWGTTLKSFIAVMLAVAVADWSSAGGLHFGDWQQWLLAAIVSLAPGVINHLNSADKRYGRGSNAQG